MYEKVLETNNLTKEFGKFKAVDSINLTIKNNSIYGLVGENGAGKSTLMRMLAGLSNKTTGSIKLFGNEVQRSSKEFRKVGNLIESPALYPNLNAYENLKIKCLAYDIKDSNHIEEILQIVGLEDVKAKKIKNFSLGMKQRLGIAMALIGFPKILILDEPINGLDPRGIVDIRNTLKEINHKYNITILISSHILEELSKVATDFGIISKGKLITEFSKEDLHKNCGLRIEIITRNLKEASNILTNNGYKNIIIDNKKIILNDYFDKRNIINNLLVNSKIDVESISLEETSFEDYYMEMIKNEKSY
ncbi:MAG: ATP-binding cassette domain-containing protein [Tissierellia bacterium]|nr:ATP-binding cassette domain-containing protein [Tissierellia bacterium]